MARQSRTGRSPAEWAAINKAHTDAVRARDAGNATLANQIAQKAGLVGRNFAPPPVKPTATPAPAKRGHNSRRGRVLVADQDSACFSDLRWRGGIAYATFAKDGSQYTYELSRAQAKEWFESDSLGSYFNAEVR